MKSTATLRCAAMATPSLRLPLASSAVPNLRRSILAQGHRQSSAPGRHQRARIPDDRRRADQCAAEQARQEEKTTKDEDKVLEVLCMEPGITTAAVARAAGWDKDGKKAARALAKLAEEKLVKCVRKRWLATTEGQKYLNMAPRDVAEPVQGFAPLTPANLAPGQFPTPARPHNPPPMPPVPN
jgi:hypothetical protein